MDAAEGPPPTEVQPKPPQEKEEQPGGPAAGEAPPAEPLDDNALLALGLSAEDIAGWKAVARIQKGRGQRSGPYSEA